MSFFVWNWAQVRWVYLSYYFDGNSSLPVVSHKCKKLLKYWNSPWIWVVACVQILTLYKQLNKYIEILKLLGFTQIEVCCGVFVLVWFFFHFCLVTILFKGNPSFSVFTIITRYLNLHIWRYLRDPHLKPVFFSFIFLSNVTISRIYVRKHPLSGVCPEYGFFPT